MCVGGDCTASWGNPINPYAGGSNDLYLAKVSDNGVLQWNTFLGGINDETGGQIAVDASGNIYVIGTSFTNWGSPIIPFVGKLSGAGLLQWNTSLPVSTTSSCAAVALDTNASVFVVGGSGSWGTPINPCAGLVDAYVAKLSTAGAFQWNTFLGSPNWDIGKAVAVDKSGNIYVGGDSDGWGGASVNPYSGGTDAFAVKLNPSGVPQWHTFLGSAGTDHGCGIAADSKGNVYVTGYGISWGSPLRPYAGGDDAFVARTVEEPVWKPRHAVADFDGDGADEVAVDFGTAGIYLYDNGAWSQISSANPESLLAADVDGDNIAELIGDLGATGLWLWNAGAWNQLSGINVESFAAGDTDADGTNEIVGDFGAVGLWLSRAGAWTQLSGLNADYVIVANVDGGGGDEIFGDFGATGLWVWNAGAWSILSGVNPDYFLAGLQTGARFILGDFGPTGLWLWSMPGLCTQLSGLDADYMIAANTDGDMEDEIIGDFGATGLWHCEGGLWTGSGFTWTILSGVNADFMIRADIDGNGTDEVVADFGATGLWLWNSGSWSQISGVNTEYLMAADVDGDGADEILADFATFGPWWLGLWMWNSGTWSQVSALNPD